MSEFHEFHATDGEGTEVHLILSKKLKPEDIKFYQKLVNDHMNFWINNPKETKEGQ